MASVRRHAGLERTWRADPDSATVAAVVDRFHDALAAGDSAAVADLLAPDATILENGSVETREEYLGGHLHGDIAFAQAVPRERGALRVVVQGDAAWATSTSMVRGEFRGREVNSAAAELMVLRRMPDAWRIAAIHWSSRDLRREVSRRAETTLHTARVSRGVQRRRRIGARPTAQDHPGSQPSSGVF